MKSCSLGRFAVRVAVGVVLALSFSAWVCAADAPPAAPVVAAPRVVSLSGELGVGGAIRVGVSGLGPWAATHDATRLVPFLNGRAIRGDYPDEVHASANHLHFELKITPQNREAWIDLLGEPQGVRKQVSFSVGPEGGAPFESDFDGPQDPWLTVIEPVYGWISAVIIVLTLVVFVVLAKRTDIIRDSGPSPGPGLQKPYNLGRTQMAFWFFLTHGSYIVIWLISDAIDTITPSLLALMGISAGTALSEVLIDATKDAAETAQLQSATAEKQALEQGIAEQQVQLAPLAAKSAPTTDDAMARDSLNRQLLEQRTRLGLLTQQLKDLAPTPGGNVSRGFLRDILSDGSGYSFHRFQIFAWTIVLGLVFVSSVYTRLTMPEFSATLLGLMGMSSGTYIGFKFPEKR